MSDPKLTDEQLAEWEALAKAATPGKWSSNRCTRGGCSIDAEEREVVASDDLGRFGAIEAEEDAAHIAFNNPAFALSAIAEIHRLRGERDEAVGVVRAINHELAGMGHSNGRSMRAENVARAFLAKLEVRG